MDSEFRSLDTSNSEPIVNSLEENKVGAEDNPIVEPAVGERLPQIVLDVMGIDEDVSHLPYEDRQNLEEVSNYLSEIVKGKGKTPNALTLGKELDGLRYDLDLDEQAEPSSVLDRISGVIKGWKDLSFIKDAREKRSIFMKLAKLPDTKSMNKFIFQLMEKRSIWQ